jgi:hypothetical protein
MKNKVFGAVSALLFITTLNLRTVNLCYGQQNLFNIPSGDITEKNKVFYQHQINLYNPSSFESKQHFVYGLGKGWDIGVNVISVAFDFRNPRYAWVETNANPTNQQALSPLVLLTAQKYVKIAKNFKFNIGTQAGTNVATQAEQMKLTHFSYGLFGFESNHHLKIMLGGYVTDNYFVGEGVQAGILAGYEIPLSKRWYLMGDFISGDHASAVSVIGGMFNAGRRVQLCAGALIANPDSEAKDGIVLELNLLGWDLWEKEGGTKPKNH